MPSGPAPRPLKPRGALAIVCGVVLLAGLIALLHGGALGHGLFMDDHAHFRQLRAADWSLGDLVAACRLELVGGVIDIWWLPETTLRFFRPLSFALMKAAYTMLDWRAGPMHAVSLGWHLLACLLLWRLLVRLGFHVWLAWAVVLLFSIHPGNVATVQWIAVQSELMVTVFLLGAVLAFAALRGWPAGAGRDDLVIDAAAPAVGARALGLSVVVLVCYVAALGCRENAIMLPAVLALMELRSSKVGRLRSLVLQGVMGVIAAGYLVVRAIYLSGAALPPKPYVVAPSDPEFVRHIVDKTAYYLLGEFLLVAVAPIGGLPYLRALPLLFYGATAFVAALLVMVWLRRRGMIAGWLGPAWLLLFMAPVLPAFESPHHLYLPGVGWAIVMASVLSIMWGLTARAAVWRRWLTIGTIGAALATFALLTFTYASFVLRAGRLVETRVIEEIASAPRRVQSGDTVYVAHLPMIAHYTQLGVEERLGIAGVRVAPLVWSPRLLGVATPSELRVLSEREIEMSVAGDRYFEGPLGMLTAASGGVSLEALHGAGIETTDFVVRAVDADERGIKTLRFTFHEPLTRPGVHLFWGSATRWAYQVDVGRRSNASD